MSISEATSVHHDLALVDVTLLVTRGTSATKSTTSVPTGSAAAHAMSQPAAPATHDETIATTRTHPWLTANAGWVWAG